MTETEKTLRDTIELLKIKIETVEDDNKVLRSFAGEQTKRAEEAEEALKEANTQIADFDRRFDKVRAERDRYYKGGYWAKGNDAWNTYGPKTRFEKLDRSRQELEWIANSIRDMLEETPQSPDKEEA